MWLPKEDSELAAKRRCGRRVADIFTWLQCFGVYVNIRGMQSPESIPEFMAYMSLIVRVSREYARSVWLNYDILFRKHAALNKESRFSDKPNPLCQVLYQSN